MKTLNTRIVFAVTVQLIFLSCTTHSALSDNKIKRSAASDSTAQTNAEPTAANNSGSTSITTTTPVAAPETNIIVLDKKFFVIHYNVSNRIPEYVEYRLTAENLKASSVKRSNNFRKDEELASLGIDPVTPADYSKTGYDRGHVAPSGDFTFSKEANSATFTMANMTPQKPNLNRIAWKALEDQVRFWACAEGELRVVAGPILEANLDKLASGVTIPQRFFKIVMRDTPPLKAIGFILTQDSKTSSEYRQDVVQISEIEAQTGIQFFRDMPDSDRLEAESTEDLRDWKGINCIPRPPPAPPKKARSQNPTLGN